ncbi:hypothetical protein CR513_19362, partial [Mucuna pruriens]
MVDESKTQRENIFHFRCHVLGNWCSIIIYGGSCVNVASDRVMRKVSCDKQVEVAFTLGRYEDKVLCDMVPMEATYLLLGRPWQFDRKVNHGGFTNRFTFVHMEQKVVIKPLFPREVQEDQNKMIEKRKKNKEVEKRETEQKERRKMECFILNTKDNLGKFDPKSDKGTFLRYSNASKAYRMYNFRTLTVEESIHVRFNYSKLDKELLELNDSFANMDLDGLQTLSKETCLDKESKDDKDEPTSRN